MSNLMIGLGGELFPSEECVPSASYSSFPPLSLLICASPSSFLGSQCSFHQGYQCPCPWLI